MIVTQPKITHLLAILSFVGFSDASAADQSASLPTSSAIARSSIGDWTVSAATSIDWETVNNKPQPYWDYIGCSGSSDDMGFSINGTGALWNIRLDLKMPENEIGYRHKATLPGDILWLYLDGERWQFHTVSGDDNRRFSNWSYSSRDDGGGELASSRYPVVRRTDADPWMELSRINEKIVNSKSIKWGFKSRDWQSLGGLIEANELPSGWKKQRYPVRMRKLKEAVAWCTKRVASSNAKVLSDDVLKRIESNAQTH